MQRGEEGGGGGVEEGDFCGEIGGVGLTKGGGGGGGKLRISLRSPYVGVSSNIV